MIRVKESFSKNLPKWITSDRLLCRDLNNKGIDLNKATYVPDKMISSGRDSRLKDPNKIQIFKFKGDVWAVNVGIAPYVKIGNRYDYANRFPMKDIIKYAEEYGYIDISDASNTNIDLRKQRSAAKSGSINRGLGQYKFNKFRYDLKSDGSLDFSKSIPDGYEWRTARGQDKSGYDLPDPQKYVKLLNQTDKSNYSKKLESLYTKIKNLRDQINSIDIETANEDALDYCYSYLRTIIRDYKNLLRNCERYSNYEGEYGDGYFSNNSGYGFTTDVSSIISDIKKAKEYLRNI